MSFALWKIRFFLIDWSAGLSSSSSVHRPNSKNKKTPNISRKVTPCCVQTA